MRFSVSFFFLFLNCNKIIINTIKNAFPQITSTRISPSHEIDLYKLFERKGNFLACPCMYIMCVIISGVIYLEVKRLGDA